MITWLSMYLPFPEILNVKYLVDFGPYWPQMLDVMAVMILISIKNFRDIARNLKEPPASGSEPTTQGEPTTTEQRKGCRKYSMSSRRRSRRR